MKLTIITKIRETRTRFLQPTRSECFRAQKQNGGELTRWTPKLARQGRNLRFLWG